MTFTFPPLPDSHKDESLPVVDQFLYGLFKKFLNNERNNYGLRRYVWVNERQKQTRDMLHFHCLFEYDSTIDYYETNLRFLNLLRRHGFNIYSNQFCSDTFSDYRNFISEKLDNLDYQYFKKNKKYLYCGEPKVVLDSQGNPVLDSDGRPKKRKESIFIHPVDFEKPINDVVHLGYYLSKYVSKDEEKEKVYCRRWASTRGLFQLKADVFNEFDNKTLLEHYTDCSEEQKEKGGYPRERQLKPVQFEYEVHGVKYTGYYFPPCFRKWQMDKSMQDYFEAKFGFYL